MKIKSIVFSIWVFALFIAIPVIIILPPIFEKYKIELIERVKKVNDDCLVYFEDLNGDGSIERIESYESTYSILSLQCFSEKGNLIDQYNFPHTIHESLKKIFFADFDNDKLKEVYGFVVKNDSVFISWVEPLDTMHLFTTQFCTTINTEKRELLDISLKDLEIVDFDGDNNLDLVFSIAVGYNWFPRKMFMYHPEINKMESSEEFGVHFSDFSFLDINNDHKLELIAISSSADNIPKNVPVKYYDNQPRIFVFNAELKEEIKPIDFPKGLASHLRYEVLNEKKGELLVLYHNFSSINLGCFITKLCLMDENYSSDSIVISENVGRDAKLLPINENEYYLYGTFGHFIRFDKNLNWLDDFEISQLKNGQLLKAADIYNDGINEYFFMDESGHTFYAFFEGFKYEVDYIFQHQLSNATWVDLPQKNQFMIADTGEVYYFEIHKNMLYFLRFPFYFFIYITAVLLFWLVQFSLKRQLEEKLRLQNQLHELQLKTLKNQLDPHFIFNTFNTIASVIKQGRNEEAYDVMVQFSKLLRKNMDSSNSIYTTLKDELSFVKDYLSIQKYRFEEMFEFKIIKDNNTNVNIEIPKMLIQIHVENALKHGIRPMQKNGVLIIRVFNEKQKTCISIEDNVIGREKSKILNKESSKIDLRALKQIIEANNKNHKNKITQEIIDLKDENGDAAGTKVLLNIFN